MHSKSQKSNVPFLIIPYSSRKIIPLYSIIISLILCTSLYPQRLVERGIIVNPLFNESLSIGHNKSRTISSVYGWGSFGNYVVDDAEHEWYQKLGMLIELYRIGKKLNLSIESHIEFIANGRNNLGFNPRAIIWEEGLLFTKRNNNSFWQIGYFHRCKHDVDNFNEGTERAMIYGGLLFKYIIPLTKKVRNNWQYLSLRSELYTILQDERLPQKHMSVRPNIEQLIGSISFNLNSNLSISENLGIYSNVFGASNFFGRTRGFWDRFNSLETVQLSGGLSIGVALQGDSHFRIGISYEYFQDNLIDIVPTSSSLLSIGIMIVDPRVML